MATRNDLPAIKTPETPSITTELLAAGNAPDERTCRSSPSSPLLERKSNKIKRRCSSFRTKRKKVDERKSFTPPLSPRGVFKNITKRLCPQRVSPPSLIPPPSPPPLPPPPSSPPPPTPSIKVFPTDLPVSPSSSPLTTPSIKVSPTHPPISPPCPSSIQVCSTELSQEENGGSKLSVSRVTVAETKEGHSQHLLPQTSSLSVESGYISDNRQSKLSLDSRGSLSNCLADAGEMDQVNQLRVTSSSSDQHISETKPESGSITFSPACSTTAAEMPHTHTPTKIGHKHVHPKFIHGIGPSSNTKPLSSISERYQPPTNQPHSPPSPDPSSPANSTTSSSSLSSFLSTSPCSSRRSSVSYSSFRKPRGSLSRTPSTRSRDCQPRNPSFKHRRTSATATTTKFFKVTPKKYLNKSRATSALHLSEVMSDDEESMTGSLRKIQIPIPALSCSQQKRDGDFSDKSHDTPAGKQQQSTTKKKQELSRETAGILSRSLPQEFGQSTSFPWGSADHEDMRTWFQTKVQEMQRKMQKEMDKMEKRLKKYSRDCKKSRKECKKLKEQFSQLELHRTASDPSSYGAIHMTAKPSESVNILLTSAGQSVSLSILPRGNSRDSMFSFCSPLHPQETLHSSVKRPDELPQQEVHSAVIRDLSGELIGWVHPARRLGLEDSVIERIQIDYPGDVREQCYQMLKTWVQQHSPTATYQTLGYVLLTEATNVYPKYVKIVSRHCS